VEFFLLSILRLPKNVLFKAIVQWIGH